MKKIFLLILWCAILLACSDNNTKDFHIWGDEASIQDTIVSYSWVDKNYNVPSTWENTILRINDSIICHTTLYNPDLYDGIRYIRLNQKIEINGDWVRIIGENNVDLFINIKTKEHYTNHNIEDEPFYKKFYSDFNVK